jgi:hypothetical protein
VPRRASRGLSSSVSPTSAPSRSCLDPRPTMGPLSRCPRAPLQAKACRCALRYPSRSPWSSWGGTASFRWLHPLRSLVPPRESVHAGSGCPAPAADALLDFCPSRAFSVHASDSLTRPGSEDPGSLPRPPASAHRHSFVRGLRRGSDLPPLGSIARLGGPQSSGSGETVPASRHRDDLVDAPVPRRGRNAPPLDGARYSPGLLTRAPGEPDPLRPSKP